MGNITPPWERVLQPLDLGITEEGEVPAGEPGQQNQLPAGWEMGVTGDTSLARAGGWVEEVDSKRSYHSLQCCCKTGSSADPTGFGIATTSKRNPGQSPPPHIAPAKKAVVLAIFPVIEPPIGGPSLCVASQRVATPLATLAMVALQPKVSGLVAGHLGAVPAVKASPFQVEGRTSTLVWMVFLPLFFDISLGEGPWDKWGTIYTLPPIAPLPKSLLD